MPSCLPRRGSWLRTDFAPDRLAIVTGHSPNACRRQPWRSWHRAGRFSPEPKALAELLPPNIVCGNPINVRGDATPARMASAVAAALADAQVDAVLCCTCRDRSPATDMRARSRSRAARNEART
jgi:acyl-CoA synthetase (NDP forming)